MVNWNGWALVPGPEEIETPLFSFEVHDEIVYHEPDEVAKVLLLYRGMSPKKAGVSPSSGKWSAVWTDDNQSLRLDLTLMEPDDGWLVWGGSNIQGTCDMEFLLNLWLHMRRHLEGVWLHSPQCQLFTPEAFRNSYN